MVNLERQGKKRIFANKRGQVTVFLIIGILLLFVVSGAFMYFQNLKKNDVAEAQSITSINQKSDGLELCISTCLGNRLQEFVTEDKRLLEIFPYDGKPRLDNLVMESKPDFHYSGHLHQQ